MAQLYISRALAQQDTALINLAALGLPLFSVARFVGELARICAPGGRVLVVTWCHRDLEEGETELRPEEEKLLKRQGAGLSCALRAPCVVFTKTRTLAMVSVDASSLRSCPGYTAVTWS